MIKKEIDCMVDADICWDKKIENYTLARKGATDAPRLKAKLTIYEEEKKITLTESELRAAYKNSMDQYSVCIEDIVAELFNSDKV